MHLMAISDPVSIKRTAGVTVENGAITSLYAATSPEALALGGKVCYSQTSAVVVNLICSSSTWSHTHKSQSQLLKPAMQNSRRSCGNGVRMSLRDTEWTLHSYTCPITVNYLSSGWVL